MTNRNKLFLTTTLPYVNSVPHIGHAFEFVLADSIARYLRKGKGNDVQFNVGLDEHGQKVWQKAIDLGLTPQEHVDILHTSWIEFCDKFGISYDTFYRTSDKSHHTGVSILWDRLVAKGDIYKKQYTGKYCVGCEAFKSDKELVDGKCPDHPNGKIEMVEEENYFFKLKDYVGILQVWLDNNKFLHPHKKLTELTNILLASEDISVSRLASNCPWGIPVPNDSEQVIYVWFDALLNYILSAGYLTDEFNWDRVLQVCGPDNLRFQGVIFQGFLAALDIKQTDELIVHGTILDDKGHKMSKSVGNVVDPIEQLEKYGIGPIRYYMLKGLSLYENSAWDEADLVSLYNNEVCNNWGNLISRVLHLCDIREVDYVSDPLFVSMVAERVEEVNALWSKYAIREALHKTYELAAYANKYINDEKPWSSDNYNIVLSNVYHLLTEVNELYAHVLPDRYEEVKVGLLGKKKVILFTRIEKK